MWYVYRELAIVLRRVGWFCDEHGFDRARPVVWEAYRRVFARVRDRA